MESADSFDVLVKALMIEDEDNRIQTLRTLIDSCADVNSCWNKKCKLMVGFEREGFTVLMVAAQYGYVDSVQVLIDAGAKVNQSDVVGQTALIEATIAGHVECIRLLLEAGADVDQSGGLGVTALTHAAAQGFDTCVKVLLEAGAKVNLKERGQTALMAAAQCGSVKCMELLLEAGADVNGVNTRGNTALINCLICFDNSDSKVCLKLLIDAGADIDVRNNNNLQPIHYALKRWQRVTFLVEYLISENCNLSHASYDQVKACINESYLNFSDSLDQNGKLDMLKLLFTCGLPGHHCQSFIVSQDTSVRNWVETVASQPNTLKSICVFKIRTNLGLGIKSKVTKLNLPNVIQNLILLKGILSLECFD